MFPEKQLYEVLAEQGAKAAAEALERGRAKAKEAVPIPIGGTVRDPGVGFEPITANSARNLTPLTQERTIEIAYWLLETNPLARGILETTRDFVIGEGVGFEAKHPKVTEIISAFWHDPVNQLDFKLPKKVLELGLYGEQCYPIFVSEFAGNMRLGYIDPADIKEIRTDPENCEILVGLALKTRGNKKGKRYQIALPGDPGDLLSPEGQKLRDSFTDGECFYFSINNVSNAVRGRSDLLSLADWLDAYEEFLFDRADQRSQVNTYVWDTTIEGATPEEIKERAKDIPAPKRGTEFIHNERIKRIAVAPDLKAEDAHRDATVFKNHILGSKGLPPPWFGEGGDVNRATAQEMEPRIIKMLSARQKAVMAILTSMIRHALTQKIERGELQEELPILDQNGRETGKTLKALDAFTITVSDLSVKDIQRLAQSLQSIATALVLAESQQWITKQDASNVFLTLVSTLGVKIKPMGEVVAKEAQDPNVTKDYSPTALGKIRKALGSRQQAAG